MCAVETRELGAREADVRLAADCDAGLEDAWIALRARHFDRLRAALVRRGATRAQADEIVAELPGTLWARPANGAALLGWIVGDVMATDPAVAGYIEPRLGADGFHYVVLFAKLAGAILVLVVGGWWRRSKLEAQSEKVSAAE